MLAFVSLPLASGDFVFTAVLVSAPLVVPVDAVDGVELGRCAMVGLWRNRGGGKFDFLSMDCRVRSKRRKSASARMRIASRSRVFESSFTGEELAIDSMNIVEFDKRIAYHISTPRRTV